jgi:hypothetical protein
MVGVSFSRSAASICRETRNKKEGDPEKGKKIKKETKGYGRG